jgi:hypothetical protein
MREEGRLCCESHVNGDVAGKWLVWIVWVVMTVVDGELLSAVVGGVDWLL